MQARVLLNGRALSAFVMLVIFVSMTVLAMGFPEKARLMPHMVGIPGSILALIQLLMEFRTALSEVAAPLDDNAREERQGEILMFAWMFLFFIGILCFGFVYAAPLLVFGFLYFAKKEGLKIAVAGGIGTWVVLYGFFQYWFEIQLFEGLIVSRIFLE